MMGESEFGDQNRPKKYHEGWVQHQAGDGKGWKDLYMVLRGEYLYIFKNDRTSNDTLIGTLHLGTDTTCRTVTGSKKSYKIEVFTVGKFGEEKVNLFKFQKENDRDLWKSFIVGISVGIVPSDVHLLPGQLKDVHVAIDEVRNLPPPLPATIPRPKVAPATSGLFSTNHRPLEPPTSIAPPPPQQYNRQQSKERGYDFAKYNHNNNTRDYRSNYDEDDMNGGGDGDDDSNHSGSFRSHLTRKTQVNSASTESTMGGRGRYDGGGGEVMNLRQLRNRQQDLVTKSLIGPGPGPGPHNGYGGSNPDPPMSQGGWNRTQEKAHHRDYVDNEEAVSNDSGYSPNHNQVHLFYTSAELNRDTPSWFFDNMPREDAESILTCGRKFGNVLMRPSSTFQTSHKYVISMRREVNGGTNLNHYEVVRRRDGFKISVDNDHAPMRSLSEVMDFFVNVAGVGTKPMRTNDLSKIYSATMSVNSPTTSSAHTPLPPTPGASAGGYNGHSNGGGGGQSTIDRMAENSFDVPTPTSPPPSASNWLFKPNPEFHRGQSQESGPYSPRGPSQDPAPYSPRGQQQTQQRNKLNVTGNVESGIAMAVSEMNENFRRTGENDQDDPFEYQNVNSNGQPPPSQTRNWREPSPDYGRQNSYGTDRYDGRGAGPPPNRGYDAPSLNQTVPAKQAPGSGGGLYARGREQQYGRAGEFNGAVLPPPPFMPPPVPPPPPSAGGIPAPPPINSQGFRTLQNPSNPPPSSQAQQQPQGYNTTPAPRGKAAGGMDFEDELRGRLGKQREQIYATGATVLRSNWN